MNKLARFAIPFVSICGLFFSGCTSAAPKSNDLLQYIPADTPYVMAFTKPLPDDLMDKFEPSVDKTLSAYKRIMQYEMSKHLVELSAEEGGAEKAEQLQAFVDELLGLLSVKGLRGAGMGRDSLLAIYGDGLLPVFRIALTDRAQFDAAIERVESKAPERLPTASLQGNSYRYVDLDEMRLIIGTIKNDAVISLVPTAVSDDRLARTLGLSKPRASLAKSKVLRNIGKEYGYTDHFISFIDVERIAASFLGDPGGLNSEFLQVLEYDPASFSEQCKAEFAGLAAIAPRIVMGYKKINEDYLDTGMVVELRDDIAAGLATLPTAVPGLGPDLGGLMSIGFSLDPLALRSFYESRLDAMEAEPFECAALGELQASTAKGREALAQPLPPVVYSFRGFLANITNIEGMDVASQTPPESVDASLLFAIENAQDLVTMAAMMSPEVAALNLIPDGKAKALNLPQLAEIAEQAFAALSDSGLSISLGDGAEAEAEAMLTADVAENSPFMSMSFDAKRYYEFIGEAAMKEDESEEGEPMSLAMRTALRDAMVSSGDMYKRMAVNVHLTKRGIELDSRMTLAD